MKHWKVVMLAMIGILMSTFILAGALPGPSDVPKVGTTQAEIKTFVKTVVKALEPLESLLEGKAQERLIEIQRATTERERRIAEREKMLMWGRAELAKLRALAEVPSIRKFLDARLGLYLYRAKTGKIVTHGRHKGEENEQWLLLYAGFEDPCIYWGSLCWGSHSRYKVEEYEWVLYELGKIRLDPEQVSKYIQEQLETGTYYKGYID